MLEEFTRQILSGEQGQTKIEDVLFLLDADLEMLCRSADRIRKNFCKDHGDLCTIINGKSGKCSEDCRFCAQSSHHRTQADEYAFLPAEEILKDCRMQERKGIHRYSIVTAGKSLEGEDFSRALKAYRAMYEQCSVSLCASHGFLSYEAFLDLKRNGVTRYHCNLETSRRFFSEICTTHTYVDKLSLIHI